MIIDAEKWSNIENKSFYTLVGMTEYYYHKYYIDMSTLFTLQIVFGLIAIDKDYL